ncbi:hypothetical protein F2P45_33585 [Massilia sp. CCM 8733]|uniref:Transposase n=1 Tax=Massilia mucilaginosa TaxID=2609282 RepID=A0ABX0P3G8_9BURK|nr:hypothetical protein [Massilia mucilaginosa]NHZ93893.1 hypothetical protein [Massilia mucilaginosa]
MRQFAYRNHVMVEHSQPGGLLSRYEYNEYATSGKITRNWVNDGRSSSLRYLEQETVVIDHPVFELAVQYRIKWRTHKIAFQISTPLISVTPEERSAPCSMLTSLKTSRNSAES